MTIRTYLARPDALSRTDLAEALGITQGRLSQLNDVTDLPPLIALKLEQVSEGVVNAADVSSIIKQARETAHG